MGILKTMVQRIIDKTVEIFKKAVALSGITALYLCTSILFAVVLLAALLTYSWGIDRGRLYQMLALAQGVDIFQTEAHLREAVEARVAELTWEEIRAIRAARDRDMEFEQIVTGRTPDIAMADARRLEEQRRELMAIARNFENRLLDEEEARRNPDLQEAISSLERLDEALAKNALVEMIDRGEIEMVVRMVRGMQPTRRADILNEMTTDDELQHLVDILQKIALGAPIDEIIEEARAAVNAMNR